MLAVDEVVDGDVQVLAARQLQPGADVAHHAFDRAARQVALVDGVEVALGAHAAALVGPAHRLQHGAAVRRDVRRRGHRPGTVAEGVDEQLLVAADVQLDAVDGALADQAHDVEQGVGRRAAEDQDLAGALVVEQGQARVVGAAQRVDGLEVADLLGLVRALEVVTGHLPQEPLHRGPEVAQDLVLDERGELADAVVA